MRVGFDSKGKELFENYVCTFMLDKQSYEGIIRYDEEVYSYVFEMLEDNFPCVLMIRADYDSINLKHSKEEIMDNDEVYKKWHTLLG